MSIRVTTDRFGDIAVDERTLLTMPSGIVGFPHATRFVILDHDRPALFKWLQAVDDPALAFVIMDPGDLSCEYRVMLQPQELAELELQTLSDAVVFVILTLRGADPHGITANLRGPVIVNERTRFAKQLILPDDLPTRFPVWSEPSIKRREPGHVCAPVDLSGPRGFTQACNRPDR
ncbi:MAG: flagellar assembly protein FliW [Nitrospiraceae bacterium]